VKVRIFKSAAKSLYEKTHILYFINLLKAGGCEIEMCFSRVDVGGVAFVIVIDNKSILIDFSDFPEENKSVDNFDLCFKYHKSSLISYNPKVYSFSPISFYDWPQYYTLSSQINYSCNNKRILCNQRPYAGAKERRNLVQSMLREKYKENVDVVLTDQISYWRKINNCLTHVFVPGARNDMIDRGHLQFLAFGCCTISPSITDCLPFVNVQKDIHYIPCADDYSNLEEKIEWIRENREKAIEIGQNAKQLFRNTSIPVMLVTWIKSVIEKVSK
jgi:hypothetical protein